MRVACVHCKNIGDGGKGRLQQRQQRGRGLQGSRQRRRRCASAAQVTSFMVLLHAQHQRFGQLQVVADSNHISQVGVGRVREAVKKGLFQDRKHTERWRRGCHLQPGQLGEGEHTPVYRLHGAILQALQPVQPRLRRRLLRHRTPQLRVIPHECGYGWM